MNEWNRDEFRLDQLPTGQWVGRFPAFERLAGLSHAVTTRSCGDFGAAHHGSDPAGFEFIRGLIGANGVAWAEHVHGTTVLLAEEAGRAGAADGVMTHVPGLAVTAFSADCTDILIADPAARAVGAIHAGWKGTANRGASSLVRAMVEHLGCNVADMVACLGPSIGPCCFYANAEMETEVRANYGSLAEATLIPRKKNLAFDLWRANTLDLESAGVKAENIHSSSLCTSCNVDLFFSWQKTLQKGTFCCALALTS